MHLRARYSMLLFVTALLSAFSFGASAETAAEAMRNFGLLGTWSRDCAKDVNHTEFPRITYDAPVLAPPTIELTISLSNEVKKTYISQIKNAVRATEEKIKIIY